MARQRLAFCTAHRIGFNLDYEGVCPQCTLAHMQPAPALDFDGDLQVPIAKDGTKLDPRTLQPVTRFDPNTGAPIQA